MDRNMLDNMSGQDIKEMINDNLITIEQLDAMALNKLMDYEIDMLCCGNGDENIIRTCGELLQKLEAQPISDEVFYRAIETVKQKYVVEAIPQVAPTQKFIPILRKVAIVAMLTALMTFNLNTVVPADDTPSSVFSDLLKQPVGTVIIDENGDTYYNAGEGAEYFSFEEFLEAEDPDILYPSAFPEGIAFDSITKNEDINHCTTYGFITKEQSVSVTIKIDCPNIPENWNELHPKYESNGKTFCIRYPEWEGDYYWGFYIRNGDYYCIHTASYEDLIFIIDNLKETKS